jgi:hypothetical protein
MAGQDRVDLVDVPGPQFWLVMGAIVFFLTVLIGSCVCCAVRCFAPENTLGPQWEINRKGERYVRPYGIESWRNGWLGRAGDYKDERELESGARSDTYGQRDADAPRLGPFERPFAQRGGRTPGFPEERVPSAVPPVPPASSAAPVTITVSGPV